MTQTTPAAEAVRSAIIELITARPMTRAEICKAMPETNRNTVDWHLLRMTQAGAIEARKDRADRHNIYALPGTHPKPMARRDVVKVEPSMTSPVYGGGQPAAVKVTLVAPPWELPVDDRSATAPRSAPIRLAGFDPLKADPVLRHADARSDRG